MNPFEGAFGAKKELTEEEKKANIEKYRTVRPLSPLTKAPEKPFVRKEIPRNDPELAAKILQEKRDALFPPEKKDKAA